MFTVQWETVSCSSTGPAHGYSVLYSIIGDIKSQWMLTSRDVKGTVMPRKNDSVTKG